MFKLYFKYDRISTTGRPLVFFNLSQDLDVEKFGNFAHETAKKLIELCPFWTMSPTVHKVLLHGKEIIEHSIAIGNYKFFNLINFHI